MLFYGDDDIHAKRNISLNRYSSRYERREATCFREMEPLLLVWTIVMKYKLECFLFIFQIIFMTSYDQHSMNTYTFISVCALIKKKNLCMR